MPLIGTGISSINISTGVECLCRAFIEIFSQKYSFLKEINLIECDENNVRIIEEAFN